MAFQFSREMVHSVTSIGEQWFMWKNEDESQSLQQVGLLLFTCTILSYFTFVLCSCFIFIKNYLKINDLII